MNTRHPAVHFLLGSLPFLLLLAVIMYFYPDEYALMQIVRVHKNAHDLLRQYAFWFTDWGNAAMYVSYLGILVYGYRKKKKDWVRFALTFLFFHLLICGGVVHVFKMIIGRPRPMTGETLFHMWTLNPHYHSFPSGHTADISGSTLALILWRRRWRWTLFLGLALALMAGTRIYLMQHYPTDTFFGWVLGSFSAWAIYTFGIQKDVVAHE